MLYTVKEVSQKTGLSPYTIRYYLREGLFPSIERDSNGTRLFNKTNIESLYIIECMKRCGMTISEIRQYMEWLLEGDQNINQCLNLFIEKQHVLEKEMKRLQECIDAVKYKVWYYQTAQEAGTMSIHDNMPTKEIPKDMQEIRSRMVDVKRLTEKWE